MYFYRIKIFLLSGGGGVKSKMYFFKNQIFSAGGGGIRLLSRSSEVECNPKMNILFFNDLGGLSSFLFHFSRCSSLRSLGQSSEVEHNPKANILFFNDLGGLFSFFFAFQSMFVTQIAQPIIRSNPEMNILFFDDLGGLFWFFCILVNVHHSDHLADHQKLNVIHV